MNQKSEILTTQEGTIMQKILTQAQDKPKLSDEYLRGEFLGAIGAEPERKNWLESAEYKQGYLSGVQEYWGKAFKLDTNLD